METEVSTDDLPDYVLAEILSYLSVEELVHSVQHVCTRWREVYGDVMLWKKLIYRPAEADSDAAVVKVLEQTPKLQTIIMDERRYGSDVLTALGENCPHLKKIVFQKWTFEGQYLRALFKKCSNLESLSVSSEDAVKVSNMEAIGQLFNLTEIKITGFSLWIDIVTLKPIADGCPLLRSCYMGEIVVMYDDFSYFIMKKKDLLEELYIPVKSDDGKCLIPLLTICTKLRKLLLSVSDIIVEAGFHALASLQSVTSFALKMKKQVDVNNIMNMFKGNKLSHLEELYISFYNNYEDTLLDVIVNNCQKLKSLTLKSVRKFSDCSLRNLHLLKDLEHVTLRHLTLNDNDIALLSSCLKLKCLHFVEIWRIPENGINWSVFKNLHVLSLSKMNVEKLSIDKFSVALPHLQVLEFHFCENINRRDLYSLKKQNLKLLVSVKESTYGSDL